MPHHEFERGTRRTPHNGVSPCRAGRGYTPRNSSFPSRASTVSLPSRLVSHGIAEIRKAAACGYRIDATTHHGCVGSLLGGVGRSTTGQRGRTKCASEDEFAIVYNLQKTNFRAPLRHRTRPHKTAVPSAMATRDAAPFASLSATIPASARGSPTQAGGSEASHRGVITQDEVQTNRALHDFTRGDSGTVLRDGGETSVGGDGETTRGGDGFENSGDVGDGTRGEWDVLADMSRRDARFHEKVDHLLNHIDALDNRLASSAMSHEKPGFFDTADFGRARETTAGVRGALGDLLKSPQWTKRGGKTDRRAAT